MERIKELFCWVKASATRERRDGDEQVEGLHVPSANATVSPHLRAMFYGAYLNVNWHQGMGLTSGHIEPPVPHVMSGAIVKTSGPVEPPGTDLQAVRPDLGNVGAAQETTGLKVTSGSVEPPHTHPHRDGAGAEALAQSGNPAPFPQGPNAVRYFAGATFVGSWHQERLRERDPLHSIEIYPVVGDRGSAHRWLASPDGVQWAAGALAVTLLCFSAIGEL